MEKTNLNESRLQNFKDTILATYNNLSNEIISRLNSQRITINWMIILIGIFAGTFTSIKLPDLETSLLLNLISKPSVDSLILFLVLIGIFSFATELLISFWIYQLFQIFRIDNHINRIERKLNTYLKFNKKITLFGWGDESKGLKDVDSINELMSFPVKIGLAMASLLQPFFLYATSLLGILTFFITLITIIVSYSKSFFSNIFLSVFIISLSFVLIFGFIALLYVHFILHKWKIGNSVFPFGLLKNKLKSKNLS